MYSWPKFNYYNTIIHKLFPVTCLHIFNKLHFSNYRYQLLKLVRAYGNIEKFDMLFHRSGPNAGQPRGFAFVTFKLRQDAIKAMNSLNGQMLGTKRISVKFAKNTVSWIYLLMHILFKQCIDISALK